MMKRLGIIGAGAMAQTVLATLAERLPQPFELLTILVSPKSLEQTMQRVANFAPAKKLVVRADLAGFLADAPDLVAECAGHAAVQNYGKPILASGADLLPASIGSLADDELRLALIEAARASGARLLIPAGAVGGVDILAAARLSGLRLVTYTGRKPPRAWAGTLAEATIDLKAVSKPVIFFEGTARQAAQSYPQNANVAATIALAGMGFDETRVRLVADPGISRNLHEITVQSACANFTVALEGVASPDNPKTSLTAGFSLARHILNETTALVI